MSCFENDKSCSRIIYRVMSHLNKVWKDKPVKEFTQRLDGILMKFIKTRRSYSNFYFSARCKPL